MLNNRISMNMVSDLSDRDIQVATTSTTVQYPYVYVLVRQDLTHEQQIVQACHATLASGYAAGAQNTGAGGSKGGAISGAVADPLSECRMIICTVPDQAALLAAADRLSMMNVPHSIFFEPDDNMGYSALATLPIVGRHRRALSKYPLLARI